MGILGGHQQSSEHQATHDGQSNDQACTHTSILPQVAIKVAHLVTSSLLLHTALYQGAAWEPQWRTRPGCVGLPAAARMTRPLALVAALCGQTMMTGARACVIHGITRSLRAPAPRKRRSRGTGGRQSSRQSLTKNVIFDTCMYHLLLCNRNYLIRSENFKMTSEKNLWFMFIMS